MKRLGLVAFLAPVALAACGGNDPLAVIEDPSVNVTLSLPFDISQIRQANASNFPTITPFGRGNNGLTLNLSQFFTGYWNGLGNTSFTLKAPGPGVVTSIDQGSGMVRIVHNARIFTQVSRISAITARLGDRVVTGSVIGTKATTASDGSIQFSVFVDGNAVCPDSYFDATSQTQLYQVWTLDPNYSGIIGLNNRLCVP